MNVCEVDSLKDEDGRTEGKVVLRSHWGALNPPKQNAPALLGREE